MNLPYSTVAEKELKCYKITEKTGNVVATKAVNEDTEVMIINTEGIIIQLMVSEVSVLGRITSGVKMIEMDSENKRSRCSKYDSCKRNNS